MEFKYEQPLLAYMAKMGRTTILVEEITSNNSDFEITELHYQLIDDRKAALFKTKKGYYSKKTAQGEVLLPPYRLKCEDVVTFGLKSFLGFKYVTCRGISH